MAASLIGISILVTLRQPPDTILQGIVGAVDEQTSTLTLQDVYVPATGHHFAAYTVQGHAIADIKVHSPVPVATPHAKEAVPHPAPPPTGHALHSHGPGRPRPLEAERTEGGFVDPAILSVGRRSTVTTFPGQSLPTAPQEAPATPIKPLSSAAAAVLPHNTSPFVGVAKESTPRKPSAAILTGPFSAVSLADTEELELGQRPVQKASVSKVHTGNPLEDASNFFTKPDEPLVKPDEVSRRSKRGGRTRRKEIIAEENQNGADLNSSPEVARKGRGNGWRQTPLLKDSIQPAAKLLSRTPGVIGGKVGREAVSSSNRKTRRQRALEAQSGWATEDATDIQDLPDFDFAGNLSKFDKRSVFDQIRNEDTTADEDRLVSFNRVSRPGTYGGKNLHPTENVLDSRHSKDVSDTSSEAELSDIESGRNSHRALSRTSVKRIPTRQSSGIQGDIEIPTHAAAVSGLMARPTRSLVSRPYAPSSHATGSPIPGRASTPTDSSHLESSTTTRSYLRIISNDRKCNTITPGGMLAVEENAEVEFGLTEDMVAENAGRGVAEVALSAINPGGRRLARENHNARPVIVVLAGNHRTGARAVAAARQLHARGPRVMVALLGFERPADWDKDVRRQVELFVKFGGWVRAWGEVEDTLKRLQAPPELIIDALLGRHKEFDALGEKDRRTVLATIGWANKSRAAVLAVETPSGVGGSTGEIAIVEGEPLEVRAKYIVCLGAPRSGLLKALQNGAGRDPAWLIWVVDIGLNRPWKNAGVGGGKGVRFGEHWMVQLQYSEGENGAEGVRS